MTQTEVVHDDGTPDGPDKESEQDTTATRGPGFTSVTGFVALVILGVALWWRD